jgi:two-component system NtrC family sensor kinase
MKPFRFSLAFSILSSLACLLVLTWILLSLISFKTAEQDLLAQKNEEGRVLLASFISILPDNLSIPGKEGAVARFIAKLARERDFAGIVVVDQQEVPVYTFGDGRGVDTRLRETLKSGAESSLFYGNGLFVMRYAPVRAEGRIVGASRLALSLAGEHERLKRSRHIFFAYFLLDFLLLLGFGSYLLSRIVVMPIKRLLTATERITAGDYSHAIHAPGSAEIGELAESFSLMQEALRSKREEVETYVRSLERANRQLQEAREESIRSEKMASVGLLAAGMAHEIGTPLSAVIGYAEIMRDELRDDPVKADYLRRIENEAGRIDRLIRGLLDYARPTSAHYEDVAIGLLVEETLELLADREAFRRITASLKIEADLPLVHVDKHQLQQVLINLFLNARDAMPEGGMLDISGCRSDFIGSRTGAPAGMTTAMMGRRREDFNRAFSASLTAGGRGVPCVKLDIRDTGEGITADNLVKVFDPFFTTKEPGKGTGLGLAICARIIDTFGGRVTLESAPGNGTVFTLWLPFAGGER